MQEQYHLHMITTYWFHQVIMNAMSNTKWFVMNMCEFQTVDQRRDKIMISS